MLSRQKAIIISPGSDGGRFTPQVRAFLRATCLVGRSDQGAIPRSITKGRVKAAKAAHDGTHAYTNTPTHTFICISLKTKSLSADHLIKSMEAQCCVLEHTTVDKTRGIK